MAIEETNAKIDRITRNLNGVRERISNSFNKINSSLSNANQSIAEANNRLLIQSEKMNNTLKPIYKPDLDFSIKQIYAQNFKSNLISAEIVLVYSVLPGQMAGPMYDQMVTDFLGTAIETDPVTSDLIAMGEILTGQATDGTTLTETDYGLYTLSFMFGSLGRSGKTVLKNADTLGTVTKRVKFSSEQIDLSWLEKIC